MSEIYQSFDLVANADGIAEHTWKGLGIGREIEIFQVAVMIEQPAFFTARGATVEVTPITKSLSAFVKAGGAVVADSEIDVENRAGGSGQVWDGCRCVPPIETTCNQCPDGHEHPQKPISIEPTKGAIFQFRLKLETFDPEQNVRGKVALIYKFV